MKTPAIPLNLPVKEVRENGDLVLETMEIPQLLLRYLQSQSRGEFKRIILEADLSEDEAAKMRELGVSEKHWIGKRELVATDASLKSPYSEIVLKAEGKDLLVTAKIVGNDNTPKTPAERFGIEHGEEGRFIKSADTDFYTPGDMVDGGVSPLRIVSNSAKKAIASIERAESQVVTASQNQNSSGGLVHESKAAS